MCFFVVSERCALCMRPFQGLSFTVYQRMMKKIFNSLNDYVSYRKMFFFVAFFLFKKLQDAYLIEKRDESFEFESFNSMSKRNKVFISCSSHARLTVRPHFTAASIASSQ